MLSIWATSLFVTQLAKFISFSGALGAFTRPFTFNACCLLSRGYVIFQLCELTVLKIELSKRHESQLKEKLEVMKELERLRHAAASSATAAQKSFDEEYREARTR